MDEQEMQRLLDALRRLHVSDEPAGNVRLLTVCIDYLAAGLSRARQEKQKKLSIPREIAQHDRSN